MSISPLNSFEENPKLAKLANKLRSLLEAIGQKEIPESIETQINEIIKGVNDFPGPDSQLVKQIKIAQNSILKILEKELSIVPKNHFQAQWMVIGMTVFGLPMGVVFATVISNFAFVGIGLPIGMAIGIAFGNGKDKEAAEKGKQLDWENKL